MPSSTPRRQLLKPESQRQRRELCFDLENRPLAYWYDGQTTSEITAFAWKWLDREAVNSMLLRGDGRFQCSWARSGESVTLSDEGAYRKFSEVLAAADLVYGHNIRYHDLPMLNAGLLRRDMAILKPLLTTDTLKDYPRRNGLSASLENLAAMYGLEGEKKTMRQPDWEKANRLSPDGLELARERVVSDVLLQERLKQKINPILKPPRVWRP